MKPLAPVTVAAAVLLFPAAVSAQRATHAPLARHSATVTQVNVSASEFKFVLSKKTARRGVVNFKVTNVGAVSHDFKISGRKTRMLSHGQSATLRVVFLRKGHYPYQCTVPGHAAAGMKGVFTVT